MLGAHDELDPVAIYARLDPPEAAAGRARGRTLPDHAAAGRRLPEARRVLGNDGRASNRWKPLLYAVITVALREAPVRAGPIVTTTFARTLQRDAPASRQHALPHRRHGARRGRAAAAGGAARGSSC